MPVENITAAEAQALREEHGTIPYLDVRSTQEFQNGHPTGAYNIPIMHFHPVRQQMEPNPDFERVVQAAFPVHLVILVGCQSGGRSVRASQIMESLGFQNLRNVVGGFGGGQDEYGEPVAGWLDCDLPVSREAAPGCDYESLLQAAS